MILGFDVDCSSANTKSVCVRLFRLLHNMVCSVSNLCNDARMDIGKTAVQEVVSEASVKQIFKKNSGKKNESKIVGLKVERGTLERKAMFRVVREEQVIAEGLKAKSLRVVAKDVSQVEEKSECGLELLDWGDLVEGDKIQSYTEKQRESLFHKAPGVTYCD